MSGKGSKPRPFSVTKDEYSKRYDAIFKPIPLKTWENWSDTWNALYPDIKIDELNVDFLNVCWEGGMSCKEAFEFYDKEL